MDDVGRYFWSSSAILLFTLTAMFFSASEAALLFFSESKLKRLSEEGNSKAATLYHWKELQFSFSIWSNVSAAICVSLSCTVSVVTFLPLLSRYLQTFWGKGAWISVLAGVVLFLITAFLVTMLSIALPKKLVSYRPEEFAFFAVTPLKIINGIFRPITFVMLKLVRLIVRICGYNPNDQNENITEEEIRMLVDAGNEKGTIEYSEREMIKNVFEFDDRTVGEIMTHRTGISAAAKSDSILDVLQIATREGFSRIPVYEEDIDNIVGIIYAKDLLELVGKDNELLNKSIKDYMRPVIYVPESTRCTMLFKKFKETKVHMAVIVDEYGGTAGVATMEDLLESIVGNIQDEYDEETDEVERLDENTYSLDGGILLEKIEELFDVKLSIEENTDTLGGMIANTLGRIPENGEKPSITVSNIIFTVLLVEDRRIVRVKARKLPETEVVEEK